VGEAGTGAQAVQLARDIHPDVVVMDIRMPGMDGVEATRIITAESSAVRVVVLSTFDDYVYAALRAGASGFLVKDVARLLAKLGARDRVQLVIVAYETGLVSPSR
jgi:DNA-binding NarL/FixJ family response regulator